jgi:hypothetical protein
MTHYHIVMHFLRRYEFLCSLCFSPGSEYSLHQIWFESVRVLKLKFPALLGNEVKEKERE